LAHHDSRYKSYSFGGEPPQERFVADASHQLLTPLTIMKGELEQGLKTLPSSPEKPVLESTLQEVEHLISLVKNLLLLARVDAGLDAMRMQTLYFDEIVLDSISRAEKLAREKEIRLKFDILNSMPDGGRPPTRGDEELLQNLVFNLIENGIKYSDPKTSIQILLQWTPEYQTLQVIDSGPGIPVDQSETIFERFRRAQALSKKAQGYGLGLAISRQIALLHGAELSASNRTDTQGSVFQLRIKNI